MSAALSLESRLRAERPEAFGKVAVLMGGTSSEREISLMSGEAVLAGLRRRGVAAHPVDTAEDLARTLREARFERAWVALHGRGGEDGTVQGLLECLGLPYTGSGVLGSALSMDKLRTKRLLAAAGLGTPRYAVIHSEADFPAVIGELGLPLITKPSSEGSSVGLVKVERAEELATAYREAARLDRRVFAESWCTGSEYTAAILQDRVLPLVRIETPQHTFYDYQAKYFSDETRYFCPSGLEEEREQGFGRIAMAAFEAVGAEGWGRVDFLLGDDGEPLVLEVNTIPGMTDHSLVPMAARQAGIDFDELVWRILETSLARERERGDARQER